MIHRFQPTPASSPGPNWPLRIAIAAATGTLAALTCWCSGGAYPAAWFCGAACFALSVCLHLDIQTKYAPHSRAADWMQHQCNAWQLSRHGVLIYRAEKPGLCIFLPWASLKEARVVDVGISMWNEETDTFFTLPTNGDNKESILLRIQHQIEEHKATRKEGGTYEKAVYLMASPLAIPVFPCVIVALPWFILGAASPVLFPGSAAICGLFLALGSSFATASHYELEEEFLMATYVGDEVRRSRRGIVTRTDEGITIFISWEDMEEAFITAADSVFLKIRGEQHGFVLTERTGYMPVRITRRDTKIHRWLRWTGRLVVVFAALIAGFLWHALWN